MAFIFITPVTVEEEHDRIVALYAADEESRVGGESMAGVESKDDTKQVGADTSECENYWVPWVLILWLEIVVVFKQEKAYFPQVLQPEHYYTCY